MADLIQSLKRSLASVSPDVEHRCGRFSIRLPADHLLPAYQRAHKLYDRFLPYLCRSLPPGSTVIDVGANCGDSLVAMYDANEDLNFVCIEPDSRFFGYLRTNVDRLLLAHGLASIQLVKSLVGKGVTSASLVDSTGGTKKAVVTDDQTAMHSETLDAIGTSAQVPTLRLIKSDVDGFDYDVVDSAVSLIKESAPILFFECQFDHLSQKQAYERTLTMLDAAGYRDWVVFDNFGEVVLRTQDLRVVLQLFEYLWRQNTQRTTRTIYYYDLLACQPHDLATVDAAVSHYVGES